MSRARIAVVATIALGAALIAGPAQAKTDYGDTVAAGRGAIKQAMQETGATSVSVALLSEGKVVWSQQFGEVTAQGTKPTPTTTYGIGSVSKMVTTLAVMRLVDQGKISLDAPVVRYIPDFSMLSPQYRQITVRMLLNHSAGLPGSDYANGMSVEPIPGYVQQVLGALRREPLKTTPGAMNVYCNDCFTLAGEVVARVSGTSFEQYAAANIFKPLGMTQTGFTVTKKSAPVIVDGKQQPQEYTNIAASGGVVSTPQDMLKLAQVFTGERPGIVSASALAQMGSDQTTTTLKAGPRSEFRYGLGWDDVADPALSEVDVTTWVKGGDVNQHHGALLVAPDQDLAVMLSAAGIGIDSGTLESIGGKVLLQALVDTGEMKRLPKPVNGMPAVAKGDAAQTARMTGVYLGSGFSAKITRLNNRSLKLWMYNGNGWTKHPGRYVLRKNGAFWSTDTAGTSLYAQRAWGRTYLMMRRISGTGTYYNYIAVATKMRPGRTLPAWEQRAGQKWLLANEHPQSVAWGLPWMQFSAIPGLSGYMIAYGTLVGSVPFDAGESAGLGSMFLQVPLAMGRDLYDFAITSHGGEDVLQFGSTVMRQQATVPALAGGPVSIGSRGFVEWRKVESERTVTLSGQSAWKVYDDELTLVRAGGSPAAEVTLKAGSYLAIFGPAGAVVTVG